MKRIFIKTEHCGQGKNPPRCRDCRTDRAWRDLMRQDWEVPDDWDEVCPWGITLKNLNKMPSLWQMFKNLLHTIKASIVHYIQYRRLLAPRVERKRRMNICKPCDYFWPKTKRCLACGCCLKAKVLLKAAECKLSLW